MSGHTPGPWSHYAARLRPQYPLRINEIHGPNGETIVKWSGFDGVSKKRTVTANARLIAAAPKLLAALQSIVASLAEHDDEGMIEHAEQMIAARAAIAEATGEQS